MPTRAENHRFWNEDYDWSDLGESWTPSAKWKKTVIEVAIEPFVRSGDRVLEIGPGAGRWTSELLKRDPERLVCVDLAERCLELCRQRFPGEERLELHKNDGSNLDFLDSRSFDVVWSFDCFVHIEKDDLEAYFTQFRRLLKPAGRGVVHYASLDRDPDGNPETGWRAAVTSSDVFAILERSGLHLVHDWYDPEISQGNTSVVVFEVARAQGTA